MSLQTYIRNPLILELFISAGWFPSRNINTLTWISKLASEGYKINDYADMILKELGNLDLILNHTGYKGSRCTFNVSPMHGDLEYKERVSNWEEVVMTSLYPIGRISHADIAWSGSNGKFYYGYEFGLYLLGDDINSAFEQIIFLDKEWIKCAD